MPWADDWEKKAENPAFDSMTFEEKTRDLIDTEVESHQESKIAMLVKRVGSETPDSCVGGISCT